MTKLELRLSVGACAALLLASCGKTHDPDGTGTNTNWLRECETSAECDDALACVCGVCTQICSEDSECGELHAATQCVSLAASSCGATTPARACFEGCDSDDDCTSVEDGSCREGVCVAQSFVAPEPPDAGGDGDGDGDGDGGGPPSDLYGLTLVGDMVQSIPSAYTACGNINECILTGTTCGCCPVAAIHTDLSDTYTAELELACSELEAYPICDCGPNEERPACREGRCVAFIPEDDCYSPFQNLDLTYVEDALGCECNGMVNAAICMGREALICEFAENDFPRWVGVEDGPCEPGADAACETGELLETAQACLDAYSLCQVMENGEFCGRNP